MLSILKRGGRMRRLILLGMLAILGSLQILAGCGGKSTLDFSLDNKILPGQIVMLCIRSHMQETFELVRVEVHVSYGSPGHAQRGGDTSHAGDRRSWRDRRYRDLLPPYARGGVIWLDFTNVEPGVEYCKPYTESWGGTWTTLTWWESGTMSMVPALDAIDRICVFIPDSDEYNPLCKERRT